jgi:hypothetical protein
MPRHLVERTCADGLRSRSTPVRTRPLYRITEVRVLDPHFYGGAT